MSHAIILFHSHDASVCEEISTSIHADALAVDQQGNNTELDFSGYGTAVFLFSKSSVDSPSMKTAVASADRFGAFLVPAIVEKVDLKADYDYYFRNVQWLSVDAANPADLNRLAAAVARSETVTDIAALSPKRSGTASAAASLACLVGLVLGGFLLSQGGLWPVRPLTSAAKPDLGPATEDLFYSSVSDDGANPFFNPPGGTLDINLQLPTLQRRGVEIAYYDWRGPGRPFQLLGEWAGQPRAEHGGQHVEMEVAKPTNDGIMCLIYDETVNGLPERRILLRPTGGVAETDLYYGRASPETTCADHLPERVSKRYMPRLETRQALNSAYQTTSIYQMTDVARSKNGGLRLNARQLTNAYPYPTPRGGYYLYGGETRNDQKPLYVMPFEEKYPVYHGDMPAYITACVHTANTPWQFASVLRAENPGGSNYQTKSIRFQLEQDANPCLDVGFDATGFGDTRRWPRGASLTPPGVAGRFADGAYPEVMGVTPGMDFETAVSIVADQFPNFDQRIVANEATARFGAHPLTAHRLEISPGIMFPKGASVVIEKEAYRTQIVLSRDADSSALESIWLLYIPSLVLVQKHDPAVGSQRLVDEMVAALGAPDQQSYGGLGFREHHESLRMVWSSEEAKGCKVVEERIATSEPDRSYSLQRTHRDRAICPANLELNYARDGYNTGISILLTRATDV